jgi:hypothetical protein
MRVADEPVLVAMGRLHRPQPIVEQLGRTDSRRKAAKGI